jgi:hypothetical protein
MNTCVPLSALAGLWVCLFNSTSANHTVFQVFIFIYRGRTGQICSQTCPEEKVDSVPSNGF